MLKVEKFLSSMEDLLQVIVAELCNQVYSVEIVNSLILRKDYLKQLDNVGVFAVFEEDYLAEDSPRFWQLFEEVDDLLDGNIGMISNVLGFSDVAIAALTYDLL